MSLPALRPLSLGETLDTAFALYRRYFVTLVLIALAAQGVTLLLSIYSQASGGPLIRPGLWFVAMLTGLIGGALGTAASTHLISEGYMGRDESAGEALMHAVPLIGQLIFATFLTWTLIAFGLIFLLVPGMILMSGLLLSSPVLTLEPGTSAPTAMRRSWFLTQGHRWRIFVILFLFGLLFAIPTIALGGFQASQAQGLTAVASVSVLSLAVQAILSIVLYPYLYVLLTVLYYDLRVRKEGFDLELLAAALPR